MRELVYRLPESKATNRDAPELALLGRRAGDAISSGVNARNYRHAYPHRQAPIAWIGCQA